MPPAEPNEVHGGTELVPLFARRATQLTKTVTGCITGKQARRFGREKKLRRRPRCRLLAIQHSRRDCSEEEGYWQRQAGKVLLCRKPAGAMVWTVWVTKDGLNYLKLPRMAHTPNWNHMMKEATVGTFKVFGVSTNAPYMKKASKAALLIAWYLSSGKRWVNDG